MQITFNTDDNLEDLSKIHEILLEAIKKKNGSVKTEQNQPQQQQIQQQPKSVFSQPGTGSFANALKQDMAISLGLGPKPAAQESQKPKSEVQIINEQYRKEYEENKRNPSKPKSENPEIDMGNIYYSEKRKRF